jgi:hypothetical protein
MGAYRVMPAVVRKAQRARYEAWRIKRIFRYYRSLGFFTTGFHGWEAALLVFAGSGFGAGFWLGQSNFADQFKLVLNVASLVGIL